MSIMKPDLLIANQVSAVHEDISLNGLADSLNKEHSPMTTTIARKMANPKVIQLVHYFQLPTLSSLCSPYATTTTLWPSSLEDATALVRTNRHDSLAS